MVQWNGLTIASIQTTVQWKNPQLFYMEMVFVLFYIEIRKMYQILIWQAYENRIYKRNEKVGHEKLLVKASKVLSKLLDELFWKFDRIQPLCLGSHFFHFIHLSFSSKKVLEINLHFVRRTCNIFSYFWVRLDEFNYSFYFVQNPLWNPKICESIWRICKYVIQTAS